MPSATPRRPFDSQPNNAPGRPTPPAPQPVAQHSDEAPYIAPLEYRGGAEHLPPVPQPAPQSAPPRTSAAPPAPPAPPQRRATPLDSPATSRPAMPRGGADDDAPTRRASTARRPRTSAATMTARCSPRRNPRVQAALCYVVPFVPAAMVLLRERHNRFVRLHAAQAVAFFALLALAQVAIFSALVAAGGFVTDLALAALLGIVFYGLLAIVGLLGLILWLDFFHDALCGRFRPYPALTPLARRIEHVVSRMQSFRIFGAAME